MRTWILSSSLLVLFACGRDDAEKPAPTQAEPASACERAVDHGIELIEAELSAGPSLLAACDATPDEVLRCYVDATTQDAILGCARAASTATLTLRPGGGQAAPDKAELCKRADENYRRLQLAAITGARADRVAACKANGGRATACQLDATTAAAWVACENGG